jgi:hypothetical protein
MGGLGGFPRLHHERAIHSRWAGLWRASDADQENTAEAPISRGVWVASGAAPATWGSFRVDEVRGEIQERRTHAAGEVDMLSRLARDDQRSFDHPGVGPGVGDYSAASASSSSVGATIIAFATMPD